jgi:hypothetical protein
LLKVAPMSVAALTQQLEDARREREELLGDLDELLGEIGWLRSELRALKLRAAPAKNHAALVTAVLFAVAAGTAWALW